MHVCIIGWSVWVTSETLLLCLLHLTTHIEANSVQTICILSSIWELEKHVRLLPLAISGPMHVNHNANSSKYEGVKKQLIHRGNRGYSMF